MFDIRFHDAALHLVGIAKGPITVALYIILPTYLDYQEWRPLDQAAVAAQMKLGRSTITKAMLDLHALGVVERRGNKVRTEWRLSPDFGWRGDVASYEAAAGRRKIFKVAGNPPLSEVAEAISGQPAPPTTTSQRQPELTGNRTQRALPLTRVVRGGKTPPAA